MKKRPQTRETSMLPGANTFVSVEPYSRIATSHKIFLKTAQLESIATTESWTVVGSNSAINYSSHGCFRYFGKFPAPIARHLITKFSNRGGLILDPACGSGTTGVEALLLGNKANLFDINPLSVLISQVKTTHLDVKRTQRALHELDTRYRKLRGSRFNTDEIDLNHWFLPQTITGLNRLQRAISEEKNVELQRFLTMNFAAIIRKVSKATTQQGRLFLDIESAIEDPYPIFKKTSEKNQLPIAELPKSKDVETEQLNLKTDKIKASVKPDLIIYHPPYFNAYKYSSINSLELAWLGYKRKEVSKLEIREFFKVGKPENAIHYIEDLVSTIENLSRVMSSKTRLSIMIGDALIRGEHIPVTYEILDKVKSKFSVELLAIRIPKHTEATWATSMRRNSKSLGVRMYDFVITLRKR